VCVGAGERRGEADLLAYPDAPRTCACPSYADCRIVFTQVAALIFVAEWGDRSMLATVALGAAQSPLGK
jgi:putative Ca2+/H+ antiporter (TMEM165/GDT1 family)